MRTLGEYIVSVSAAAFLCGILNSLMLKGTAKEVLKLTTGLFLAFCVISPVADLQLPELTEVTGSFRQEAREAAAAGEELSRDSLSADISRQLEAYILDIADSMGLSLTVQVELKEDDSFLPRWVTISGDASDNQQQELNAEITEALGLSEEDITWIQTE